MSQSVSSSATMMHSDLRVVIVEKSQTGTIDKGLQPAKGKGEDVHLDVRAQGGSELESAKRSLAAVASAVWPSMRSAGQAARQQQQNDVAVFYELPGNYSDRVIEEALNLLQSDLINPAARSAVTAFLRLLDTPGGTALVTGPQFSSPSADLHEASMQLEGGTTVKPAGCLCVAPRLVSFTQLPPEARTRLLKKWARSANLLLRLALISLRPVIINALLTTTDDSGYNPFWKAMGYRGRPHWMVGSPEVPSSPSSEGDHSEGACSGEREGTPRGIVSSPLKVGAKGAIPTWLEEETTRAEEVLLSGLVDVKESVRSMQGLKACLAAKGFRLQHADQLDPEVKAATKEALARAPGGPRTLSDDDLASTLGAVVMADVVVIGSGAGGGPVAAVLAEAGLRVIVIEKGSYYRNGDLPVKEVHATSQMLEASGVCASVDGSVAVVAGSTLGGGTKINWSGSLKTPPHVRKEWAQRYGLLDFTSPHYDECLDTVCDRLGVHTDDDHYGQNQKLKQGFEKLGVHHDTYPRNCKAKNKDCSGYCSLGCKRGGKQSTDATWLVDMVGKGGRVMTNCHVDSILTTSHEEEERDEYGLPRLLGDTKGHVRHRKVLGVLCGCSKDITHVGEEWPVTSTLSSGIRRLNNKTGAAKQVDGQINIVLKSSNNEKDPAAKKSGDEKVLVVAPLVVCCAGAIHSPAVLTRSGITAGGRVGKNLRLHPASAVFGVFPRNVESQPSVNMWDGGSMTAYSRAVADWEDSGYGALVFAPMIHPGMLAGMLPWTGGEEYKKTILALGDTAVALALTRDQGSGEILTDPKTGRPLVKYWPIEKDRKAMMKGLVLGLKSLVASGAEMVGTIHRSGKFVYKVDEKHTDKRLEKWLESVMKEGARKYYLPVVSAHQMCTTPLGTNPDNSVLSPDGETWEVSNLYVADAGVFPTCPGANPMITIEATAYMIAEKILTALERKKSTNARATAASPSGINAGGPHAESPRPARRPARRHLTIEEEQPNLARVSANSI